MYQVERAIFAHVETHAIRVLENSGILVSLVEVELKLLIRCLLEEIKSCFGLNK